MRKFRWTVIVLLSCLLLGTANEARARAGSGQDAASSSSSSDHDDSDSNVPVGMALGIGALGLLGMLLVAKLVATRWRMSVRELTEHGRVTRERAAATIGQGVPQDFDLSLLTETDPDFDLHALTARVARSAVALQEAWSKRDLQPCRSFLSDGVYNRLTTNLELLARAHQHNQMSQIQVTGVSPVGIRVAGGFQILELGVRFSALDHTLDTRTKERVSGSDAPTDAAELWALMRRPGATTRGGASGMDWKECPQCGAPMRIGAASRCAHCKALINSGTYDWVLAEITQLSGLVRLQPPIRGAELLDAHESLTIQGLEDRASAIFWTLIESAYQGDATPLRRLAEPALLQSLSEKLDVSEPRRVLTRPAVETVDTREIRAEQSGLRATVAIRWSGYRGRYTRQEGVDAERDATQGSASLELCWSPAETLRPFRGLASAGCGRCGGPLERSDQAACPWCRQSLAAQPGDWVLVASSFHGHG